MKQGGARLAGNRDGGDVAGAAEQSRPFSCLRWRQRLQHGGHGTYHFARDGHVNRPVMLDQLDHQHEQQQRARPTAEAAMPGEQHRQWHQRSHRGGGHAPGQHLGQRGLGVHRLVGSLACACDCGQQISAWRLRHSTTEQAQRRPVPVW